MTQTTKEDELEAQYEAGSRMAWLETLGHALRGLGRGGPEWDAARLIAERELVVSLLRRICADHGDNDWDDDLNLSDVIEKHLARYLEDETDDD